MRPYIKIYHRNTAQTEYQLCKLPLRSPWAIYWRSFPHESSSSSSTFQFTALVIKMHQVRGFSLIRRHSMPASTPGRANERESLSRRIEYTSLPRLDDSALLGEDRNSLPTPIAFSTVQRFSVSSQLGGQLGISPVSCSTATIVVHIPRQAVARPDAAVPKLRGIWERYRQRFLR
jgi:hypothetical protein